MSDYIQYPLQGGGGGGGGGITSINGDTTAAQVIAGGTGISVATAAGTTTITNTSPSSGGTVTSVSVTTANGVSGTVATATTTPAISLTLSAITPTSVAASGTVTGSNLSGTNTGNVTIGTANGLSLAAQAISLATASTSTTGALTSTDWNTFNGKGAGTVTSVTFTGDGTVLSSTPSSAVTTSGTVTAALATASPFTMLANDTTSIASPTYVRGEIGLVSPGVASGTLALTVDSPSYQMLDTTLTNALTATLPKASTCPNKVFVFQRNQGSGGYNITITTFSGDTFNNSGSSQVLSSTVSVGPQVFRIQSDGGTRWLVSVFPILLVGQGGTGGTSAGLSAGCIIYGASAFAYGSTAVGTSGQILQSAAAGTPTWTSTPGSGTALTSVSVAKTISAGTSPTVAAGGTIGGGTVAFVGTAHDESGQITITAGAGTTAAVITVTFGSAAYATTPNVVFSAANSAAAGLLAQAYISAQSTTAFSLSLGALSATTYIYNYHVKQ